MDQKAELTRNEQILCSSRVTVRFTTVYSVALTFALVGETLKCDHSNKRGYWAVLSVVLFVLLRSVVLPFGPVDETLKCDHLNESYWAVLSSGTVLYNLVLSFESVDEILKCEHIVQLPCNISNQGPKSLLLIFSFDNFIFGFRFSKQISFAYDVCEIGSGSKYRQPTYRVAQIPIDDYLAMTH